VRNTRNVSRNKSSLLLNGVTGFFITLSNPMIVLLFVALFSPFDFVIPEMTASAQVVGYLAIFAGAMLWWFFITYLVNKLGKRFDVRGIAIINKVVGGLVMVGSLVGAILIATGTFSFH
jgi:threonine/homoserine/homoserine lactone efflux protein